MKVQYDADLCVLDYGGYKGFVPKVIGEAVERLAVENSQLKKENDELKQKIREMWGEP